MNRAYDEDLENLRNRVKRDRARELLRALIGTHDIDGDVGRMDAVETILRRLETIGRLATAAGIAADETELVDGRTITGLGELVGANVDALKVVLNADS
ncbi:hypothetical protein [Methylohalobius crimeensis]|uniref:hypothetical protein n=1 Tax=Methylohalobius crimeensis TaxID=244365 RepID=UPI0003B3E9C4|nr:hypothetical protein [Methylohalobius crimeensis]